ncbi:glycine--tRNA ligase subunit beta [Methylomarinum vadi]|uniref:glycine--tRNA ligase subunit beta n=1 Tax=Methylomarinum vadi TaxID=438855 RepID=UPI0004DF3736|nr:glycine--tRNA ligase subunit beta [Methylomarinum vadi]
MAATKDLLFEIGCEELPPKTLLRLSQSLGDNLAKGLHDAELTHDSVRIYATPRRLAVIVGNLVSSQPDKTVEKRGPAIKAAFADDGTPSKAAQGFAASCGTTVEQLGRLKTGKGEWLAYTENVAGKPTDLLLPELINKSIQQLPIAKRMRWGRGETEFARPVHWILLLFGGEVIDCEILGLKADRKTYGHRFHAPQAFNIDKPLNYVDTLYEQGKVIADFERRKSMIRESAKIVAAEVNGIAHIDEDLLEEIAAINEWPVPVIGNFDSRFLELPVEVLITTMQSNQKYFPVKNSAGGLLPHFITFSNIESSRPESIQYGNERVILPRLADAEFFWNQDRKQKLENRVEKLDAIVFQRKLGTLGDKTRRVGFLADHIAGQMHVEGNLAKRAALLAKTDLLTEMVGEFANLQGIMGRYYALADGEPNEVASALEEQYFPKQAGGPTPSTMTGQILSIAEKIDTLCGIFSAGLIPTGDKDPYALRRATLGILRIIIENQLNLDVIDLIDVALAQFNHEFDKAKIKLLLTDFIFERLKGYSLDKGFRVDEFEAVISVKPTQPLDFMQRLQAVKEFRQLPEAASLAAANKRIINILKKTEGKIPEQVGTLVEAEEIALLQAANASINDITPLLNNKDYQAALARLARLRDSVDDFFDHVMVNTEDQTLRNSRLALLTMLSHQFLEIADISKLQS